MNIDYLLKYLIDEGGRTYHLPESHEDKLRLFRALVNVREPKPISNEFLKVQDEFLQTLIAKKGITTVEDLPFIREGISLWRGDITTLKADAIVNAANSAMIGCFAPNHACIDNAIHTFAGVQLRLECAEIMQEQGCPESTGQAKITAAYNLPSKHILHTVGAIIYERVTDEDRQQLANCYRSCLELASENGLKSVAFCCISTGEFRFPNQEAAEIAIQTVSEFLQGDSTIRRVIFNVFTKKDERIYNELLR